LLFGIFALNMELMHGSAYAKLRTIGILRDRFRKINNATASVYIVLFIIAASWITFIPGYQFTPDASLAHLSVALNPAFTSGKVT
ncbi:cytochrome d ubiquinol oxidase subunit II, partial [Francisella tularensis subsp. holarctica]|nr:cytochrome d ubiquinol oxidase subunit II [Francisella tularensis subsp. holarctica]